MIFFKKKPRKNDMEIIQDSKLDRLNHTLASSFANVQRDTVKIFQWLEYLHQKNMQQERLIHDLRIELKYIPKSPDQIKELIDKHYDIGPIIQKVRHLEAAIETLNHARETLPNQLEKLHSSIVHDEHLEPHINLLHNKMEDVHDRLATLETRKSEPLKLEIPDQITIKIEELHRRLSQMESSRAQGQFPSDMQSKLVELTGRLQKVEEKKQSIKEKIIKNITKNSKEYVKTIILSYIKKYGNITALQLKEMVVDEQGLCSKSSFYRLLEEIEQDEEIASIKKGKIKHYMFRIQKKNLQP